MRPAARALLAIAALGLAATRAVPPPTPPAGFYRTESEGQEGPAMVRVVCFARGHGNALFGEGAAATRPGDACGLVTVTTVGDGWQSRQRCSLSGRTADYATHAERLGPNDWRVVSGVRFLSASAGAASTDTERLHRVAPACPRGWRPGDYMLLTPHQPDAAWSVHRIGGGDDLGRVYDTLPPALQALVAPTTP